MARIAGVNIPDNKHAVISLHTSMGSEERLQRNYVNLLESLKVRKFRHFQKLKLTDCVLKFQKFKLRVISVGRSI